MPETIIKAEISEEMSRSYTDYAMSVIVARALPDIRDGLKPVQRRILFSMLELGTKHDKNHRKCARIVGDTMGKYHPHGDSSIYDALVVMSQDFKKEIPLIDGHGNFGSIEGDGAAAQRYTEARLQKFTEDVCLKDMDKNIVDFVPNFDGTEKEPEVLPNRVPNFLINGSDGIAVGMATSTPPHNLAEVINGILAYLENKDITTEELMKYIKGPDFPTGGVVINKDDLLNIYETGSGKIRLRGKVDVEYGKKKTDKHKIVISEIPYTMIGNGISKFFEKLFALIEEKKLNEITDVSNESSKEGIRIVIEVKNTADPEKIINLLYKKTGLEDTFGVNMLAIENGTPVVFSLKHILEDFIKFQYELNTRKYTYLLEKELQEKEIKEGLVKACDMIDYIIEVIRGSRSLKQVKECLITGNTDGINFKTAKSKKIASSFNFTENQTAAIVEMRLYKLIGLEIEALQSQLDTCLKNIKSYEKILSKESEMKKVIKKDLIKIQEEYADDRKTLIENGKEAVYVEEAIAEQEIVFALDKFGYAKMYDATFYDKNAETIDSNNKRVFRCMNTDKICIFTDNGQLHQFNVMDVPMCRLKDKGKPIDNMSNYNSKNETILYVDSLANVKESQLVFTTHSGLAKIVPGSEFVASRRTITSTKLQDEDKLVMVSPKGESNEVIVSTENGMWLRFKLEEISSMKKVSAGMKIISLAADDKVANVVCYENARGISEVSISGSSYKISDFKLAKHGGKGTKKQF